MSNVQHRGRRCEALPRTGQPRICEDSRHRYELRRTRRDLHLPRTSAAKKTRLGDSDNPPVSAHPMEEALVVIPDLHDHHIADGAR